MPHFIIECSEKIISIKSPIHILQIVCDAAESTQLFDYGDIKGRINSYKHYTVGNSKEDFIHVFANIMEGRTISQKKKLSTSIVSELINEFPNVSIISMNIRDFEEATYCNKFMI